MSSPLLPPSPIFGSSLLIVLLHLLQTSLFVWLVVGCGKKKSKTRFASTTTSTAPPSSKVGETAVTAPAAAGRPARSVDRSGYGKSTGNTPTPVAASRTADAQGGGSPETVTAPAPPSVPQRQQQRHPTPPAVTPTGTPVERLFQRRRRNSEIGPPPPNVPVAGTGQWDDDTLKSVESIKMEDSSGRAQPGFEVKISTTKVSAPANMSLDHLAPCQAHYSQRE